MTDTFTIIGTYSTGSEMTRLTVSSSGVVSICPGKQLSLVCTVNHSLFLKWAITIPQSNSTQSLMTNVPYTGLNQSSINLMLNDIADTVPFHFTRISESGMLPVIAELLVDRVSTDLNGTDVQCLYHRTIQTLRLPLLSTS
jgi:hypothetical protein